MQAYRALCLWIEKGNVRPCRYGVGPLVVHLPSSLGGFKTEQRFLVIEWFFCFQRRAVKLPRPRLVGTALSSRRTEARAKRTA